MTTRRLSLLGIAAVLVLGACSSSEAKTTAVTPVPATEAAATTSTAPTTAPTTARTTAAPVTTSATTAAVADATVTVVSQALVAKTGGKVSATDATCIASGLLARYTLPELAAMQSGPISAEAAAATSAVIAVCVGPDRAAEVGALLAASPAT